jgi:hypothetical protein
VLTVVLHSPLLLKSKSSMPVRDILMSPSVAQLAVKQREPSTIASEVTDLTAKCIPQYVLSAVRTAKCPSSRERADQYIVVSATTRLNWTVADNLMRPNSKGAGTKPSPRRFRSRSIKCVLNKFSCTKGKAIEI